MSPRPNTIKFEDAEFQSELPKISGQCYCQRGVIVEVTKEFETRYVGNILQVRAYSYIYVARIEGVGLVLKYHTTTPTPPPTSTGPITRKPANKFSTKN